MGKTAEGGTAEEAGRDGGSLVADGSYATGPHCPQLEGLAQTNGSRCLNPLVLSRESQARGLQTI